MSAQRRLRLAQHAHLRLVRERERQVPPVRSDAPLAALTLASVLLLLYGLWLIAMRAP